MDHEAAWHSMRLTRLHFLSRTDMGWRRRDATTPQPCMWAEDTALLAPPPTHLHGCRQQFVRWAAPGKQRARQGDGGQRRQLLRGNGPTANAAVQRRRLQWSVLLPCNLQCKRGHRVMWHGLQGWQQPYDSDRHGSGRGCVEAGFGNREVPQVPANSRLRFAVCGRGTGLILSRPNPPIQLEPR